MTPKTRNRFHVFARRAREVWASLWVILIVVFAAPAMAAEERGYGLSDPTGVETAPPDSAGRAGYGAPQEHFSPGFLPRAAHEEDAIVAQDIARPQGEVTVESVADHRGSDTDSGSTEALDVGSGSVTQPVPDGD